MARAHKLARIWYTAIRYGVAYQKRSGVSTASVRRRISTAKELGYELTKVTSPPDTPMIDEAAVTLPASAKLRFDNSQSRKLLP